jgi:outer membrane lipoprotein-sorting protein
MNRVHLLTLLIVCGLSACQAAPPPALQLSGNEAATIQRVQAYLDGIHTLQARFLEIAPNGGVTDGMAWMQRPGRLRLADSPPGTITLVVANGEVVLHNAATQATSSLPLSRTPLSMLLAPSISLSGPVTLTAFNAQAGQVQLTMVRTDNPGQGSLTVTLSDNPLVLRELRMVDAQGQVISVRLFGLQTGIPIDPDLFQIQSPVVPAVSLSKELPKG